MLAERGCGTEQAKLYFWPRLRWVDESARLSLRLDSAAPRSCVKDKKNHTLLRRRRSLAEPQAERAGESASCVKDKKKNHTLLRRRRSLAESQAERAGESASCVKDKKKNHTLLRRRRSLAEPQAERAGESASCVKDKKKNHTLLRRRRSLAEPQAERAGESASCVKDKKNHTLLRGRRCGSMVRSDARAPRPFCWPDRRSWPEGVKHQKNCTSFRLVEVGRER